MTASFLKSNVASIVGLTLEGRRLEGVVLRRTRDALAVETSFEAELSADPLTGDIDDLGREIRTCLDKAGIRERRCVAAIPLSWLLTLRVDVPAITGADLDDYIGIKVEEAFQSSAAELSILTSSCRSPAGSRFMEVVAVAKVRQVRLEGILAAARLIPVSLPVQISEMQPPADAESNGVIALLTGETDVDLQVSAGGGVLSLRSLHGIVENGEAGRRMDGEFLNREIRLSLNQLPEAFRKTVTVVRVLGRVDRVQALARVVAPGAERQGLAVETRTTFKPPEGGDVLTIRQPALVTASRFLAGKSPVFEFLPRKVSRWNGVTARFSSRRVMWAAALSTLLVLGVTVVFTVQHVKLSLLESRWRGMESRVTEIETLQENILKFRPWYDRSAGSLLILKMLTEVFPDDGVVVAKTVEIRDLSEVTCSGSAQDYESFLKVLDRLRQTVQVSDIKTPQLRGRAPLQFTLNFRWTGGGGHEN